MYQAAVTDHAQINKNWAIRYSEQGQRLEGEVARRTEAVKDAETIRKNDIALSVAAAREQWEREDVALREQALARGRHLSPEEIASDTTYLRDDVLMRGEKGREWHT